MIDNNIRKYLDELAQRRIIILDGSLGMFIQTYKKPNGELLSEQDYRGERFVTHPYPIKNLVDVLCLTKPEVISSVHEAYLEAGADIIETCSFNSNFIELEKYGLENLAYELSYTSANLARKAADKYSNNEKRCFVAGCIGPTSKSASITPDLDDLTKRAISTDELEAAYYDNARGLINGGVDVILIETMFDGLNAKAALFAVNRILTELNVDIPVMVSATISESGFLLTGQDLESFNVSLLPFKPWAIGVNCSFGAEKLTPYLAELSKKTPCKIIAYPNAGLPNKDGSYSDTPLLMADKIEKWFKDGIVNIVGGCCGSTPEHIMAITAKSKSYKPRITSDACDEKIFLAGTNVLEISKDTIGSFQNITCTAMYEKFLKESDYESAVEEATIKLNDNIEILFINPDMAVDPLEAVKSLIFLSYSFSSLAKLPICIESNDPKIVEAALKCLQGKGIVKCNRSDIIKQLAIQYGAEYYF